MARATQKQTPEADDLRKELEREGYSEAGGEVEKWDDLIGQRIDAQFVKMIPARDADSSPVLVVRINGDTRRFWCPTILESKLEGTKANASIVMRCNGQIVPIKNRKQMAWGFDVFVKEA